MSLNPWFKTKGHSVHPPTPPSVQPAGEDRAGDLEGDGDLLRHVGHEARRAPAGLQVRLGFFFAALALAQSVQLLGNATCRSRGCSGAHRGVWARRRRLASCWKWARQKEAEVGLNVGKMIVCVGLSVYFFLTNSRSAGLLTSHHRSLGFYKIDPRKRRYPASRSCGNFSLVSGVRGQRSGWRAEKKQKICIDQTKICQCNRGGMTWSRRDRKIVDQIVSLCSRLNIYTAAFQHEWEWRIWGFLWVMEATRLQFWKTQTFVSM